MNLPIYQKALRYIEANPHAYDPGRWFGSGGCCIIGHILAQQGLRYESLLFRELTALLAISLDELNYIGSGENTIEKLQQVEAFYIANPSGTSPDGLTLASLFSY